MTDHIEAGNELKTNHNGDTKPPPRPKLTPLIYDKELQRLQRELVKLQEWVREQGLKLCVLFEGRDAAGKGGTIKRNGPAPRVEDLLGSDGRDLKSHDAFFRRSRRCSVERSGRSSVVGIIGGGVDHLRATELLEPAMVRAAPPPWLCGCTSATTSRPRSPASPPGTYLTAWMVIALVAFKLPSVRGDDLASAYDPP